MIDRAVGLSSTPSALTTFALSQHSVHWCHLCCAWLTWAQWIWLYLLKCICKDDLIRSRCKMSLLAYLNAWVNVWFPYNVTFKEMWSLLLSPFHTTESLTRCQQSFQAATFFFFLMMENPFFPQSESNHDCSRIQMLTRVRGVWRNQRNSCSYSNETGCWKVWSKYQRKHRGLLRWQHRRMGNNHEVRSRNSFTKCNS